MHKSVSPGRFPTLPRCTLAFWRHESWPDVCSAPFRSPQTRSSLGLLQEKLEMLVLGAPFVLAAAGWSFLYLLFGGGLGGAVLIFIVLKLLGR
jgi:hypothetical protein